jgi:thiamine biosynthesis lipoprotein
MGSAAEVHVVGDADGLVALARRRIEDLEARWSRFLPTSEISRLNASAETPVPVSPETYELIERALDAWRMTEGRFDPTVLGDVLRAGYVTSFEHLPTAAPTPTSGLRRGAEHIELDATTGSVCLPAGVGFDPGGIGKGLAADLVVAELLAWGADGACVNLGGDLRVAGDAPEGSWVVAIEHPWRPGPTARVYLRDGGVATSSRTRRRWATATGAAHHLIDPTRGEPADVGVLTASAVAAAGWQAEAFAKAAFVAGLPDGLDLLDRAEVGGLLVDDDGAVLTNRALWSFTDGAPAPHTSTELTA